MHDHGSLEIFIHKYFGLCTFISLKIFSSFIRLSLEFTWPAFFLRLDLVRQCVASKQGLVFY